ncbi:MAG: single-stranded DNA-binding protein [Acholeplasmatales bacterium]|nr:single-stranded DNA-binding protein [Acholeplasmatales bacterium]
MNKVILVGRITKDPELRNIQSGSSVVNFTLAVSRPTSQNSDQNASNADFINCVIWNKQAENLAKYVKKGSLIGVEGRIQTRNYEANGVTRYITEVLCDNVQFLETKNDSARAQQEDEAEEDSFAGKIKNVDDNDLPF